MIRVFDYGVTDDGPYYTMELLDGSDLSRARPAALGGDLPGAARRGVGAGDLALTAASAPRHAAPQRADDGRRSSKLIDFGAMAPMGWVRS